MKLNSVLVPTLLSVLLFLMLSGPTAFADDETAPSGLLTCQIEYWSVSHVGERDGNGWLLAWKAKVSGDLTGELRYWFPDSPPAPEGTYAGGTVGYYLARWELWNGDEMILAGESAGKTVIPDGQDGIWDGQGLVMEANGELSSLTGRKTYETGTVIMPSDPAVVSTGSGMFVIY